MRRGAICLFIVALLLLCPLNVPPSIGDSDGEGEPPRTGSRQGLPPRAGGSWHEDLDESGTTATFVATRMIDDGGEARAALDIDPTRWSPHLLTPVLSPASSGKFDDTMVVNPTVLYRGGIFHTWYQGVDEGDGRRMGYATSFDGTGLVRENGGDAVLDTGASGKFDDAQIGPSAVVWDGSEYKMWTQGREKYPGPIQTGLATSPDGITWTRRNDGDPVIPQGGGGDFDAYHVSHPTAYFDGSTYHLWYCGYNTGTEVHSIGYATSSDGISWTKQNDGEPVLGPGPSGKFDETGIRDTSIVFNPDLGTYELFYMGEGNGNLAFGLATSTDGVNWHRENGGDPVFEGAGEGHWDEIIGNPNVIKLRHRYLMWYSGEGISDPKSIGLVTADKYRPEGHLTSEAITMPGAFKWDFVSVDKREPSGTSVKISILDGKTETVVPGYENLSGPEVDISGISWDEHPILRIRAHLSSTDGEESPCVFSWGVSWRARDGWYDPFVGKNRATVDHEAWLRDGKVVLDGDPAVWTKHDGNPVLKVGNSGEWDSEYLTPPHVSFDGDQYVMYFGGHDGNEHRHTGMATSLDGITWTKDPSNPLLSPGPPGTWYDERVAPSTVLYDSDGHGEYKLWHGGFDGSEVVAGYSVSIDGKDWSTYPEPILDGSGGGSWDDYNVWGTGAGGPFVLLLNKTYHGWYSGTSGSSTGWKIGYASSDDGIFFVKPDKNKVLAPSSEGFDSFNCLKPSVLYRRDSFYLFYGGSKDVLPAPAKIGYATSPDGISWTKQNGGKAVLKPGKDGSWDDTRVVAPFVMFENGIYKMWYIGLDGGKNQIGYAVSSRYESATVTSDPIFLPSGRAWDVLVVEKAQPDGTSIKIDVFDANTDSVINGFESITTDVRDLSKIDPTLHPSIRLKATLKGDGSATPTLDAWGVKWGSIGPPVVNITNPTDLEVIEGDGFLMTGTVEVPKGDEVERMTYRIDDGVWTSMVEATDWSVQVSGLAPGRHILDVRASTKLGEHGQDSVTVIIKDDETFMVVITHPAPGQEVPDHTTVEGILLNPGGGFVQLSLVLGDDPVIVAQADSEDWAIVIGFKGKEAGRYNISVSATNETGAKSSDSIYVEYVPPPTVTIISPALGAKVSGEFKFMAETTYTGRGAADYKVLVNGKEEISSSASSGTLTLDLQTPDIEPGESFEVEITLTDRWNRTGKDNVTLVKKKKETEPATTYDIVAEFCLIWVVLAIVLIVIFIIIIYNMKKGGGKNERPE